MEIIRAFAHQCPRLGAPRLLTQGHIANSQYRAHLARSACTLILTNSLAHTPAPQPLPLYPFGGVAPTLLAQHAPVHIVNQGKPIVNVHENQLLGGDLPERFLFAQHRGSLRGVRGKITEAGGGGGGKGGEEGHIRVVPKTMFRMRTRNRV